jgi:hypothetical protein
VFVTITKKLGDKMHFQPQLGMMIAGYKRFDGCALGSDKFGESSGERMEIWEYYSSTTTHTQRQVCTQAKPVA